MNIIDHTTSFGIPALTEEKYAELEHLFLFHKKNVLDQIDVILSPYDQVKEYALPENFDKYVALYDDMVHASVLKILLHETPKPTNIEQVIREKNKVAALTRTLRIQQGYDFDTEAQRIYFPKNTSKEDLLTDGRSYVDNLNQIQEDYKEIFTENVIELGKEWANLDRVLETEYMLFNDHLTLMDLEFTDQHRGAMGRLIAGIYHQLLLKIVSKVSVYKDMYFKAKKSTEISRLSREEAYLNVLSKVFREVRDFTTNKSQTREDGFEYFMRMHEFCTFLKAQRRTEEGRAIVDKFFAYGEGVQQIVYKEELPTLDEMLGQIFQYPIRWGSLMSNEDKKLLILRKIKR